MLVFERIASLCEREKIKPSTLAKELGFSSGLMSQWKSGAQKPSAENLSKIAEYFNVTTDYLLGRTDNPSPPNTKESPMTPLEAFRIYAREKLGHDPTKEELRDIDLATDIVIKRLENERK